VFVTSATPPRRPIVRYILQECPRYEEERQTFHVTGTLRDILGDDSHNVLNAAVFFDGTEISKLILLYSTFCVVLPSLVLYKYFIGPYTACFIKSF
jgi:hypothetical protein